MWKRDEGVKPSAPAPGTPAPAPASAPPVMTARTDDVRQTRDVVNIGKSVVIKGELNGSEDLTVEGYVEGRVELRDHVLTIGPNGRIKAEVFAKAVIVLGEVTGNVTATEKVDIRDKGSVDGDIIAPRVAIAEGAHFRGSVDMQRAGANKAARMQRCSRNRRSESESLAEDQTTTATTLAGARGDCHPAPAGPEHRPPRTLRRSSEETPPECAVVKTRQSEVRAGLHSRPPPTRLDAGVELPDESGHSLTGFLSRLGSRRAPDAPSTASGAPQPAQTETPAQQTKALKKFLTTLATQDAPVLLDLGPVIGANLTFFGETLGCKVFIEDVYADVERHVRAGTTEELPALFARRFTQPAGSIDGILAWDLIDYLDPGAAQVLSQQLTRLLKVNGALLGFFNTVLQRELTYTKFVIVDDHTLRQRPYAAARGRQRVLQNRDIIRLFDALRVSDSFLLQTNLREILFRKPSYLTSSPPGT
jgi:cytoskeletal protein CcmA (bactofilin family)